MNIILPSFQDKEVAEKLSKKSFDLIKSPSSPVAEGGVSPHITDINEIYFFYMWMHPKNRGTPKTTWSN